MTSPLIFKDIDFASAELMAHPHPHRIRVGVHSNYNDLYEFAGKDLIRKVFQGDYEKVKAGFISNKLSIRGLIAAEHKEMPFVAAHTDLIMEKSGQPENDDSSMFSVAELHYLGFKLLYTFPKSHQVL